MDVLNLEETEALSVLNGLVEDDAMEFDAALEQIDELFGEIRGIAKKLSKYRNRNQRIETLRGNIDRHAGKLRTKGVLAYDDSKAKAQHATLDRIYHDSSLPRADYEKHSNIIKDQDGAQGRRQNLMNRAARWDKVGASMQAKDGKARPPKVRHLSGMREGVEALTEGKKYIVTGRHNEVVGEHDDLRKAQRHADNEEAESGYIHLVHQVVAHPKRPNTHKVVKTWEQNHGHFGGSYWESRKPEEHDEFTYPMKEDAELEEGVGKWLTAGYRRNRAKKTAARLGDQAISKKPERITSRADMEQGLDAMEKGIHHLQRYRGLKAKRKFGYMGGVKEEADQDEIDLLMQFHEAADQIEAAVLEEGADLDTIESELNEGQTTRKFAKWFRGSARRQKLVNKLDAMRDDNRGKMRAASAASDKAHEEWKEKHKEWNDKVSTPFYTLRNAGYEAAGRAADANRHNPYSASRAAQQPFKDAANRVLPAGTTHPSQSAPKHDNTATKEWKARYARDTTLGNRIRTVDDRRVFAGDKKRYLSGKGKMTEQVNESTEETAVASPSTVKQYALIGAQLNPERNKYAGTMINEAYADHASVEEFIRAQIQAGFGRDQILGKMIAEGADGQMVQHVRRKIDAMYNKNNRS